MIGRTTKRAQMTISRRDLLRQFGSSVATGAFLATRSEKSAPDIAWTQDDTATQALRLDRNENAYGPSAAAIAAIQAASRDAHLFPGAPDALIESLAKLHGVKNDQILLGAGSSEIFRMAAAAYLSAGRNIVLSRPTYEVMEHYARPRTAEVIGVPLRKDHSHDLAAMLGRIGSKTRLVYIANPNNPTATLTDKREIEDFLKELPRSVPVVLDEAYHEYAGGSGAYASFVEHAVRRENLIVSRTFSKAYGLAGLRLGYAVGEASTLKRLAAERLEQSVSRFALLAGQAALLDQSHIATCVHQNQESRQEFINQVNARMLRLLDPHCNFACLNVMSPAGAVIDHYRKHNVVLPPEIPLMPNYVRVSLGTVEQMKEFWRVWDLQHRHPMAM